MASINKAAKKEKRKEKQNKKKMMKGGGGGEKEGKEGEGLHRAILDYKRNNPLVLFKSIL